MNNVFSKLCTDPHQGKKQFVSTGKLRESNESKNKKKVDKVNWVQENILDSNLKVTIREAKIFFYIEMNSMNSSNHSFSKNYAFFNKKLNLINSCVYGSYLTKLLGFR